MRAYIAIFAVLGLLLLVGCTTQDNSSAVATNFVFAEKVATSELVKHKSLEVTTTAEDFEMVYVTLGDVVDLSLESASTCMFEIQNMGVTANLEQDEEYTLRFTASKTGVYEMTCTNGYNGKTTTVAMLYVG